MMEMALIRHGKTRGNTENRYIGTTDEPLLASETERLQHKRMLLSRIGFTQPDFLFVSPMKRCVETADILFPEARQIPVQDFRECAFGDFENRNYQELRSNADYQKWIDSGGTLPFPGGESMASFQARVCRAFLKLAASLSEDGGGSLYHVPDEKDGMRHVAVVAHGGTIMAVLERFAVPHREYFDWHVDNGDGFLVSLERTDGDIHLEVIREIR